MEQTLETWRSIPCPLCGGSEHVAECDSRDWILDTPRRLHVVRCKKCDLAFLNPRPGMAELGTYYPASYVPYHARASRPKTQGLKWLMLRRLWGSPTVRPRGLACLLADLCVMIRGKKTLPFGIAWRGEGRILDFGCGSGEFLRRMHHLGWKATGVDFSSDAVASVRQMGIEAFQGTFPHDQLAGRQFDVITMRMSLEHVDQPLETVRFAASLLAPGGQLAIVVPNFASCYRARFGEEWYALDLPRHLTHFEPATLRRLLESAGLDVVDVTSSYDDGVFRKTLGLCKKRGRATGIDGAIARIKPLRKMLGQWRCGSTSGDDLFALAQRPGRAD